MRIKKCWVESCDSSSDREKDKGVTYHKLPKDDCVRAKWLIQTRLDQDVDKKLCLVCSRHFRRVDFELYKASIFTLKVDAIPTIFPWGTTRLEELEEKFLNLDVPITSTSGTCVEFSKETEITEPEMSDNNENDKKITKSLNSPKKTIESKNKITPPETKIINDVEESKEEIKSCESSKIEEPAITDETKDPEPSKIEEPIVAVEAKDPEPSKIKELTTEDEIKDTEPSKIEEPIIADEAKDPEPMTIEESADKTKDVESSKNVDSDDPSNVKSEETEKEPKVVSNVVESAPEKHPPDVFDSCGKDSEDTEESQSDSDHKNCDSQENSVPEIETILENIFGPEDMSMVPVKNDNSDSNEKIDNDPIDDPNKSLRDMLSQPVKQVSKTALKPGSVGRPKRRIPLTPKHPVKSKSKTPKQKWVTAKTIEEEKPPVEIKQEKGVLLQGARVEAKDFNDIWYPARVMEVDHDEMEVLIHYDNWSQRFDEWIYMWSPRIRVVDPAPPPAMKTYVYEEGERCLARWSNNQRFNATVQKVLPNGQYEVIFDDGLVRITKASMMSKKISSANRGSAPITPNVTNVQNVEVTSPTTPLHNHLFDPKRDHLGTKEERRNLKKKIDVKELFSRKKKKTEGGAEVKSNDVPHKDGRGRKRKVKSEDESSAKDVIPKIKKKEAQVEVGESVQPEPSQEGTTCSSKETTLEKLNSTILSKQLSRATEKLTNPTKLASSPAILPNKPIQQVIPIIKPEPSETIPDIESNPTPIKEEPNTSPALNLQNSFNTLTTANISCNSPTLVARLTSKPVDDSAGTSSVDNANDHANAKQVFPQFNVRAGDKDWCCKWLNNQPVGSLIESESQLDRITVQVTDHRLPMGWRKLLTKKRGTESNKWDVVIICPAGRRYRTRGEMQERLMEPEQTDLLPYASGLLDFSAHRKQSRRKGWDVKTAKNIDNYNTMSEEQQQYVFNKKKSKKKMTPGITNPVPLPSPRINLDVKNSSFQGKDYIFVGSLKVQVIENLLRCPKEGCFKNFRKDNLLQMHIKHYHPDMCKFFGDTPNVADLAYARVVVDEPSANSKAIDRYADVAYGVKKESEEDTSYSQSWSSPNIHVESNSDYQFAQNTYIENKSMFSMEECEQPVKTVWEEKKVICNPDTLKLKFFTTKPEVKRSHKRKVPEHHDDRMKRKRVSDQYVPSSDYDETRSSFGIADRSFDPNISIKSENYPKIKEEKEDSNHSSTIITESGEKIKIVHMKREEIINCHCGFGEEDGLMIQCELCLCWQHALCHNIEKESEVPDKYVCLICLQPYRGRRSQKHLHAQEWLYEGRLPRAVPTDSKADVMRANLLKKSHELTANLLQLKDLMHSLRCKIEVAEKKDHPKLYLWSKPWENEMTNNEFNNIKSKELKDMSLMSPMKDNLGNVLASDGMNVKEDQNNANSMESQLSDGKCDAMDGSTPSNIFSNLLSSPGGTTLELPITNSELETLAKSVQSTLVSAPQPEAAIESSECRVRLLQHIERTQLLLEARLDSIEAQIAELESQDPSMGDDETPDHYPRTKQTIQMLLRDMATLEVLGTIS